MAGFTRGFTKTARCWKGYKPVKGKKAFSPGSCEPIKKEAKSKTTSSPKTTKATLESITVT